MVATASVDVSALEDAWSSALLESPHISAASKSSLIVIDLDLLDDDVGVGDGDGDDDDDNDLYVLYLSLVLIQYGIDGC